MLRQAKERTKNTEGLSFIESDIRDFRLNQTFDVAMALFHVMSYQVETEGFLAVLQNVYEHLREGGVFVFDTWYGPAVLTERPELRVKRLKGEKHQITRIAEPVMRANEDIVDVNYDVFIRDTHDGTVKEIQEVHTMRYYFLPEVRLMLETCGFQLEKCCEFMTEKELGEGTWGSLFVARKGSGA